MALGFKYSLTKTPRAGPVSHPPRAPALVLEPGSQTQAQAPCERLPGLTRLPGAPQFLYSPTLLEVLPKEAALSVLVRSLRDPSPEIRVLSLQGLGNILFHPEKVSGCGEL